MKNRIFGRFSQYKKWNEYLNRKSFEFKFSIVGTVTILLFLFYIDLYNNFYDFLEPVQNIALYLATASLGMLGIILAGIAIFITMLDKEFISNLERVNPEAKIKSRGLLVSFEFLAFNISILSILLYMIYLILFKKSDLLPLCSFYIIMSLVVYFLLFNISYILSLISNCVRLFYINTIYQDISDNEKEIQLMANSIKVDYLLFKLSHAQKNDHNTQVSLNDLLIYVDTLEIERKEYIKRYLQDNT